MDLGDAVHGAARRSVDGVEPLQVTGLDQQFALYPTQAAALVEGMTA